MPLLSFALRGFKQFTICMESNLYYNTFGLQAVSNDALLTVHTRSSTGLDFDLWDLDKGFHLATDISPL